MCFILEGGLVVRFKMSISKNKVIFNHNACSLHRLSEILPQIFGAMEIEWRFGLEVVMFNSNENRFFTLVFLIKYFTHISNRQHLITQFIRMPVCDGIFFYSFARSLASSHTRSLHFSPVENQTNGRCAKYMRQTHVCVYIGNYLWRFA